MSLTNEHRLDKGIHQRLDGRLYEIRFSVAKDQDRIISNVNQVINEGSFLYVQQFTLTDDWKACLVNGFDKENRRILVVATIEEEVIGHCRLFPIGGSICTTHVGDVGLVVLSQHRNSGVGSSLLSHTLSIANNLGYQKITLCAASENAPVLHLAKKLGFVEEGRRARQYFINGRYMDEVLMAHFIVSQEVQAVRYLL